MMTPLQRGVSAKLSASRKSQAQPLPPGSAQVQGQSKMLTQPREGWYLCPPTIVPLSCERAGSVELRRFYLAHASTWVSTCNAPHGCALEHRPQPLRCYRTRQDEEHNRGSRSHHAPLAWRP